MSANDCGYHVIDSLDDGIVTPKIASAMAVPPDWPGYPTHMIAPTSVLSRADVKSSGPPFIVSKIHGIFASAAAAQMLLMSAS